MTAIVYEITAKVQPDLCQSYEDYMQNRHIPDLLATRCFGSASFERSEDGRYQIRYYAETRQRLEEYLRSHAPRLRSDFQKHFPVGVELSREEWSLIRHFP
ncbi:MAG TPA: DUF4286 family protein [Pyrinomonadaceae bacterium]